MLCVQVIKAALHDVVDHIYSFTQTGLYFLSELLPLAVFVQSIENVQTKRRLLCGITKGIFSNLPLVLLREWEGVDEGAIISAAAKEQTKAQM